MKCPVPSLTADTAVMGNVTLRALIQFHTFFRFAVAQCQCPLGRRHCQCPLPQEFPEGLAPLRWFEAWLFKCFNPCFSLVDLIQGDRFVTTVLG